jgi:prophage regulatory protein
MRNRKPDYLALYIEDHRLVRKPEIQKLLGISRSTLARRVKSGIFPPPSVITNGWSYWLFKDIQKWLPK